MKSLLSQNSHSWELALHYERGQLLAAAAQQLAIVSARALDRGAAHESLAAARHALTLGEGQLAP
ncbi:MAG: Transcriptional regulator HilA [Ramlibacter sp.]|nr:Transcriptional regulator HilA [Ramlibacter sp.]